MRVFYETTDGFFSKFGDPQKSAQTNGGMTWSIRLGGIPFTDPVAALSVLAKDHRWELGFALGLIVPLTLALLFGRVFCSYICPASLLFFAISRLRRILEKFFWLPDFFPGPRILLGRSPRVELPRRCGLDTASGLSFCRISRSVRPCFTESLTGPSHFPSAAWLCLAFSIWSWGKQFTCRYVCPTGRLLGAIGRRSFVCPEAGPGSLHRCLHGVHRRLPDESGTQVRPDSRLFHVRRMSHDLPGKLPVD